MEHEPEENPGQRRLTVGEHLEELRARALVSLAAVVVAMIVCWVLFDSVIVDFMKAPLDMVAGRTGNPFTFRNPILDLLRSRLNPNLVDLGQLNVLSVFEPITVRMKVSLLAGVILASPVVIAQAWRFVGTGLYAGEKRYIRIYGISSLFLFLFGCAFSFFFLFPIAVAVLLGNTRFGIVLRLQDYVSQATFFTVGIGMMFELPLVLLFLERVGIVDVEGLRSKRKHVIVAALILAAVITPPDPLTQVIVAVPILILYELSLLILRVRGGRSEQEES